MNQTNASLHTTLKFDPGKMYEVTGIWIEAGKKPELEDYFGKVYPIAAERYGVRRLLSLEPASVYSGNFLPDVQFVAEWPSPEAFESFIADPEVKKLFPQRDAATSKLAVSHYRVPEAREVEVNDGDWIEYNGMWITPGKEAQIEEYYGKVFPIAVEQGLKPLSPLVPVAAYRGDFFPTRAALLNWGSQKNFDTFIHKIKTYTPQRDAALDRLEVMHARARIAPRE